MSQTLTVSAHMAAVRLKSANKYIFRALLSLASAALLTRLFGMLNQIIVTSHFGIGAMMDAYFVASNVPMLIALLIASAIEASIIPIYTRIRLQGNKESTSLFFSTLLNVMIVGAILLTGVMLLFGHQIILLSAPGLDPLRLELSYNLIPIIYPALAPMIIIGFLECVLNSEGQFGWPAYSGLLVPLASAVLILTIGKSQGVVVLCMGTLVGLGLQLCMVIVRARHAGIVYRPVLSLSHSELSSILIAAWPVLISSLISQGSPLVDQIFASSLSAGSISALNYALKLVSVPTGVIFVSVGRAALPYLSRQAHQKDMKAFKETLHLYLWTIGIGTTILSLFMLVLAHPIVQILFQRGEFSAEDTTRTANVMVGFVIGLTPLALGYIAAKSFAALGKTRVLLYSTILTVSINAIFDYIFARLWQSFGIALATSLVNFCSMFFLLLILSRTIGKVKLFMPPQQIMNMIKKVDSSYNVHQQVVRIGIVFIVFATGIIGASLNALYALRISLASILILAFLRYRYSLLMTWVIMDAFIGSTIPFFNGKNLDTALTVPTLLLMFCIPIKQTFKRMPALAFLFIFLLWQFASIVVSTIDVGKFMTVWLLRLDFLTVSVLLIEVIITRQRFLKLIDAILWISMFISLYGIYGDIVKQNGVVDGTVPFHFRIGSIFGDTAPALALFLSLTLPLAIYRTFTLRGLKRIIGLIVVFTLLLALMLTYTRTAYISVPLSVIIMGFSLPPSKMRAGFFSTIIAVSSFILLIMAVAHISFFDRFFNQDYATLNGRTYIWQALVSNFDPNRLLGNGLLSSDLLLTNLQIYNKNVVSNASHSLLLTTLYEHGVIGLALLILVFTVLVVNLISGMRKATGEHRALFATSLAAFVSMFLQALDANETWNQGIGLYFWIIVALPFALCWSTSKRLSDTSIDVSGAQKDISDRSTELQMEAIQLEKMR